MKFTKDMIGKEIYAIPTGNAARGNPDKIQTFKVDSIGRVYVGLSFVFDNDGIGEPSNYHPETGATQKAINSGYAGNSGYLFFDSLDALADHRLLVEIQDELERKLRYIRARNFNKSQVERILQILAETDK